MSPDFARHGIPAAHPQVHLSRTTRSSRFSLAECPRICTASTAATTCISLPSVATSVQPFFNNEAHADLFLLTLERVPRRYRLVVLGCVVMPEHVHLLVSEPQRATLSTAIQALKLGFVRSLPGAASPMSRKRSETWGTPIDTPPAPCHFWQARYYDFNVWTEKKRIEKLRYIHRNPVTRGLVDSPEKWKWSSFRWYLLGEIGPVKINDTDILAMKIRPTAE
jgi:putative transposase